MLYRHIIWHMTVSIQQKIVKQGSKNISIKMLKDVGMTVPKSRETSVVYICSNTGNEGLYLYAARQSSRMKAVYYAPRQGMRACNNNNMRNPSLHLFHYGVTHVIIVACPHPRASNILPSSSVLLHINIVPHSLCCCIYILYLFLYFLALSSLHPLTF